MKNKISIEIDKVIKMDSMDVVKADKMIDKVESKINEKTISNLFHYLNALNDSHSGDCTCQSYSCDKCHAESLLDINTIEGLGKYEAYQINNAFKDKNNIDKSIITLANYQPLKNRCVGKILL